LGLISRVGGGNSAAAGDDGGIGGSRARSGQIQRSRGGGERLAESNIAIAINTESAASGDSVPGNRVASALAIRALVIATIDAEGNGSLSGRIVAGASGIVRIVAGASGIRPVAGASGIRIVARASGVVRIVAGASGIRPVAAAGGVIVIRIAA